MSNRLQIRTDFVNRVHLLACTKAQKFDAFRVELLGQNTVVTGKDLGEAWSQAMQAVAFMRGEYAKNGLSYPPSVFSPFAVVTAVELARESAALDLRNGMGVGGCFGEGHPVHEERVRALSRALDAIEFLHKRPQAQVH